MGIGKSATRQFSKWPGVDGQFEALRYKPMMSFLKFDGEVLLPPFLTSDTVPDPIHRARLLQILYDYAVALGIPMTFGKHIVEYFEAFDSQKAGVMTVEGERFQADVVVAADGIGSKSWKLIGAPRSEARSSGFSIYRTSFPTTEAHKDLVVKESFPVRPDGYDDTRFYLAPGGHAISVVSKDITTWLLTHSVSKQSWVVVVVEWPTIGLSISQF